MTRGQDALGMDLDGDDGGLSEAMAGIPLATFVVTASADEEAEHAKVLAAVAKECKGTPLWQA
jgi:hypothetical protein